MQAFGIVLIHGYSGRSAELSPLRRLLIQRYGRESVRTVDLPGHSDGRVPDFDALRFGCCIDETVQALRSENRHIILLGHSTGGLLALEHIGRTRAAPALLILAAAPATICSSDLGRWERHRRNRKPITLLNVARLVSWANRVATAGINKRFPVLVLQGGGDPLVPAWQAEIWRQNRFSGPVQCLMVPAAGHNLFAQPDLEPVADYICRAVSEVGVRPEGHVLRAVAGLKTADPNAARYLAANRPSSRHLLASPAASRVLNRTVHFGTVAATEPLQLNIEITSRCDLACGHCARSRKKGSGKDMDLKAFEYLLDLLPNTFKVTLVGLGEPTLHAQLPDFIHQASRRGHLVSLVTNAMQLEKNLSRQIIAAGIGSITFSLDSVDPEQVSRVRKNSDISRIIKNIRDFISIAGEKTPAAVFTAVSKHTAGRLPALAVAVAGLGVKAWMLSDLNFKWNQDSSLRQNWTRSYRRDVGLAIKEAFSRSLPVLSVRAIEELGLDRRYTDFLLTSPTNLQQRSESHTWCLSPWQTLPVDVDGNALACDCRPDMVLGNVLEAPFTAIWNGSLMRSLRRRMRSADPPADCLACPRF